jgi:hypothetical protein
MKNRLQSVWTELAASVADGAQNKRRVALACIDWHTRYKTLLARESGLYQLDRFERLDISLFMSPGDVFVADDLFSLRALLGPLPKKSAAAHAACRLRDLLELAFATKNEASCVRCGGAPVYAMSDSVGKTYWECAACGLAQLNGVLVGGKLDLSPPCRYATPVETLALLKQ